MWAINRVLYSSRLKLFKALPFMEILFEKNPKYPKRIDIFHIDIQELKNFLSQLETKDKEALIHNADNACEGKIKGFSSIVLNYGNPINWQLNPLTQKHCDVNQKWYRISDFNKKRGDIKVVWEASRFSHFITFARAYLLTNDIKYYQAFSEQLAWWLESNPYSYGANYKCGQECALRMTNAILANNVFRNDGITTDEDDKNIKELIYRCYKKILGNFFYANKCIKNNHTVSELMGMIIGAWCCNDKKRLKNAFIKLNDVIEEQFFDDGGYRQFSFNYQRLVLQDLECILAIENKIGFSLSEESKKKIKLSALLMYQCQDISGNMPNYGSNDGALIFPVTSCNYRDFRPVINSVYALITGKQLYGSGKYQEELIWFADKKLENYKMQDILRQSSQFSNAGLYTLRNKKSWAMIVLNEYHSRPAHLDQLHFDLWIDNQNVLCDAGTYSYASELGRTLIQNESHNTVQITGVRQMNTYGPFMIYDWTHSKIERCGKNIFEGKMISKNGYEHMRRIQCEENTFVIRDVVSTNGDWRVLFHTPCKVKVRETTVILFVDGVALCRLETDGKIKIEKSKRSLLYLNAEEINCISIHGSIDKKEIQTKIKIIKGEKSND